MEIVMEIFVLMGSIDYEADYLLGVYASEQEAVDALGVYVDAGRAALGVYYHDRQQYDRYYIERRTVGAPAEYDAGDLLRRYL